MPLKHPAQPLNVAVLWDEVTAVASDPDSASGITTLVLSHTLGELPGPFLMLEVRQSVSEEGF